MKFYLKSDGKIFRVNAILSYLMICVCIIYSLGCSQIKTKEREELSSSEDSPEKEYSIKADREEIKELRKDIPKDKQDTNDELAFVLNLTRSGKEDPNKVRSRFDAELRKVRNRFRDDQRKTRENYTKEERDRRSDFLKKLNKERDDFKSDKNTREENKEFYNKKIQALLYRCRTRQIT